MNYLIIDKDAIIHHFNIHSHQWENNDNITLKIHLLEKDIDEILPFLLKYSNDLAYSIMNEICQMNNLEEKHLKLLYDKGDTACKVSICLRKNLPKSIVCRCENSLIEEVKYHYLLNKE